MTEPGTARDVTGQPVSEEQAERPYKRLSPLTPLVRSFVFVVVVLFATWDDLLRQDLGPLAWGFLAVLLAGAAYGAASWFRTKYWVQDDELRVDTGLVSRQSRRIRVDRLQGIDIVQPFVARLFGLAELRMDVAGGGSGEGTLAYVRLEEAHDLRATLLARRDTIRTGGPGAPDEDASPTPREPPEPDRELARLGLGTLLVSLLLSTETVFFALAAVAFGAALVVFGGVGGLAGALPVLAGFAIAQFRKLSAYYRFTLSTASGAAPAVQVRRGLFERSTQTLALPRVQGLVVTEPFLWRATGWARLDVSVSGDTSSDEDGKPSASTVMPVAPLPQVLELARVMLRDAGSPDVAAVATSGPPRRARWLEPVGQRFLRAGIGEHLVVGRVGVLTRRTHVVPHARVQSLQLHQGPLQRRLGLADLQVDSPPGPVRLRIRHRDAGEARDLLEREHDLARAARRPLVS